MKQAIAPLGFAALGAALFLHATSPVVAQSAPSGKPVYRGTTAAKLLTDAGHPAMNAACVAEFPGTRICLSSEVLRSVPAPTPGEHGAYLISDNASALPWGNMAVVMSDLGLGFSTNCAEVAGLFKTKKDGSLTYLEADGNLRTGTCKDVYAAGGLGVACCGY